MKEKIILVVGVAILILAIQYPFPKELRIIHKDISDSTAQATSSSPIATSTPEVALVTQVVDGDTIVATIAGVSEKIRLIGVDTPETVDPRKPVQCFGVESSAFTKSLLLNATVRLEADPSQGDRDKYGRLLRYVFLGNINISEEIIAKGYGHEYTYGIPYKYQAEFKNAEQMAREAKKGLWANGVCEK